MRIPSTYTLKPNKKDEVEKAYFYKLLPDGVKEYAGEIIKYGYSGRKQFVCDGFRSWDLSMFAGEVYRLSVWFRESNMEEAKKLFREYELDVITKAEKKIETAKRMLEVIKSTSK